LGATGRSLFVRRVVAACPGTTAGQHQANEDPPSLDDSGHSPRLGDGRIATGGGYATRQLHTDDDEILFDAVGPTLITSVSDVIARSDFADRAILIELPSIPEDRRQPEEEFNARLEAARPRILGALLDAMVVGMHRQPAQAAKACRLRRLGDRL
jgi:hypothetical protein